MIGSLAAAMDDKTADVALEAACVKVFGSELIWRACDDMVQVAGGRGYVKPYPYERMMRDARINRIFEGANDVLRLFVGLNGIEGPSERLAEIGTALRSPIQNWNLVAGYATERVKGAFGATDRIDTVLHERLREHVRFFEKHVAELRTATDRAIMRYRKKIIERQLVVERLANMVTELYARATTLSRTQRFIDERGVDGCVRELQLCDLFCVESGRRFRASRVSLEGRWEQVDDTMRTVAASLRAAGSYFVEDAILEDSESLTSPNARGVKAYVDDLPRPVKKTSAVH
jgi:alkylation response protein AidB-like acyl-CoA dehydrogenase